MEKFLSMLNGKVRKFIYILATENQFIGRNNPVQNSIIKSELLAEMNPQILCDFYEKHLKFGSKNKNKQK